MTTETEPVPDAAVPSGTATGPAEGNWRERAERAEAQLAAVDDFCRTSAGINYGLVKAGAILAITGTGKEPLSAVCTGPDCGEQFADSETGEYLFATRERMERLLYADGWQSDPVLCPACQEEAH